MRISLWIPAIVFNYAVRIVLSNCIQVGTVLFTPSDLVKKCWTESDKALLKARLIMQDVLPDPDCIDFSKPDAILTLLDYFQSCYNIIGISSYGNMRNLMTLALSDSLGGYLRVYALPLAKRAYYSGQVNYSEAKKLFQLYNDIKVFLKTNGLGWAKPQKLCKPKLKAKPLVISNSGVESPCNQLYMIEKKRTLRSCNTNAANFEQDLNWENSRNLQSSIRQAYSEIIKKSIKNTKQNWNYGEDQTKEKLKLEKLENLPEHKKILENKRTIEERKNDTKRFKKSINLIQPGTNKRDCVNDVSQSQNQHSSDTNSNSKVIVPLPILEDGETLHTIAVPFKDRPLRNIHSRKSAFILEQYYVTVIKCMMSKSSPKKYIKTYNAQFQTWLVSQVIPHLTDEQWYPAFGGVYRIIETIKKLGSNSGSKEIDFHDIGFIFSKESEFKDGNVDTDADELTRNDKIRAVGGQAFEEIENYGSKKYWLYGIFILMVACICIICSCISYCCTLKWEKMKGSCSNSIKDVVQQDKDEGLVNFQFLIKFFKKDDCAPGPVHLLEDDSQEQFYKLKKTDKQFKIDDEDFSDSSEIKSHDSYDNVNSEQKVEDDSTKKSNAENKRIKEDEENTDGFQLVLSALDPARPNFSRMKKSHWPYRASHGNFKRMETAEKPPVIEKSVTVLDAVNFQDRSQFERIWKKSINVLKNKEAKLKYTQPNDHRYKRIEKKHMPASILNKGGKITGHSFTKEYSSCEYCETCQSSTFALINSSSQIQIEEKISAEGVKFYNHEPVLIKRKAFKQRFVEESTVESQSENERSYSSETESTETTLN